MASYRVLIDCTDEKGLVYKVSGVFFNNGLNILKNDEFVDRDNNRFFMRSEVVGDVDDATLVRELSATLPESANIRIIEPSKKNIVLMATKESHCLGDILIRYEDGELNANILAVISNYDSLGPLVKRFNIPFVCVPHDGLERSAHEEKILEILADFDIDYIVLAKYMRVLTPGFVARFEGQIINIHHSFLPAFIGANPYRQAFDRGVKIIGATAHFVNNNLDEGPIIAQSVISVDHTYSWQDMRAAGRDVEKVVLAKALKLALEDRIFVYANKTVIF